MINVKFEVSFNKEWKKNLPKIIKYLKRDSDYSKLQIKNNYFCIINNYNMILIPISEPKDKDFTIEKILDIDSDCLLVKEKDDPCIDIDGFLNPPNLTNEKIKISFLSLKKKDKAEYLSRIPYKIAKTFNLIVNIEDLEKVYIPLFESIFGSFEITIKANIVKNDNNEIKYGYFIFENEYGIKFINASILPND